MVTGNRILDGLALTLCDIDSNPMLVLVSGSHLYSVDYQDWIHVEYGNGLV